MDRSYLSQAEVVAASSEFVCIRLSTYESQAEADFLKTIYVGRSGEMENTTFAILSPDGKKQLARAGRGPMHAFRGASDMARGLKKIAAQYPARKKPLTDNTLPLLQTIDLGLNVASCDSLPVIITFAESDEDLEALNQSLVPLAWDKTLAGQYAFATTTNAKELKPISGLEADSAIAIVSPDEFGLSGKVLAQFKPGTSRAHIRKEMISIASKYPRKSKDRRTHTTMGISMGIDWETAIPETDEQALRAEARMRAGK